MNKAPEQYIVDALNADAALVAEVGKFHMDQWPRGNVRLPIVVAQLINDSNDKVFLRGYGGSMGMQFDLYSKDNTPAKRQVLKDALRKVRGTVGDLRGVWIVITNEMSQGVDPAGAWRWTVDATVNWEEHNG